MVKLESNRFKSICNEFGGKCVNDDLCLVDGYPLALREADYLYGFKPKSQIRVAVDPNLFLSLVPYKPLNPSRVEELERRILSGKPIDPAFIDLDYKSGKIIGHEGRHRAKVASELGLKKFPVIIYCRDGETGEYVDKKNCKKHLLSSEFNLLARKVEKLIAEIKKSK